MKDFARYLRIHYRLELADVIPTESPGYWRLLEACGGRDGGCHNPIHGTLFNEGPTFHTIRFTDSDRDEHGRWASPYRTWRAASAQAGETTVHQVRSLLEIGAL